MRPRLFFMLFALMWLPLGAAAQPDASGSTDFNEPNGFPPICDAPCYTVQKSFEVYLDGNAGAPGVCAAGQNTYVYTLEHLGGSSAFVPAITSFEVGVEADDVASAGFIPSANVDPSSTTVDATNDVVTWGFTAPTLANGTTSSQLFICSTLLPGTVTDTMASVDGQASLDASATCVGPKFEPPDNGEPITCTIGFWKNRSEEKKGTLQHFPDGEYGQVCDAAAALSNGLFADCAALEADLTSKGNRTDDERARQQFAAFLLNLAAGDLFPDNSKCKLFDGNLIDSNGCGTNVTIADAVDFFFANYNNGDFEAAKDCADDTNNGIGVYYVIEGE